jgi:hypothetical protein
MGEPSFRQTDMGMDQNSSPTQFHDYSMDSVVAFVTVSRAVLPSHIFAHQHSQISPLCFNVGICLGNALPQLHEKIQRYPKRGGKKTNNCLLLQAWKFMFGKKILLLSKCSRFLREIR